MRETPESPPNIAVFADYENVALGVRDAKYPSFDIELVLQRLLDKGNVVVKKAYSDWDRYRSAVKQLHQAAFELIEIPHVSYSGKNSADIRLVVDALDLCYTKEHVDVFVIISGDSDFSPLVSKLRENNKQVIGLGVKNSSSDLLIDNCDEFIYYDDLVREQRSQKHPAKGKKGKAAAVAKPVVTAEGKSVTQPPEAAPRREELTPEEAKMEALEQVLETVESLFRERDANIFGSMVKQTLKRKRPMFNEAYHGYGSFNELLEDAEKRGLLKLQKEQKSGGYLILGFGPAA
ncbi:MAG TPA: NYN domain-containing protein [Polyangiales bacterium]|nr:NYN domain-containing protein [Polyangiales bacterium]